MRKLLKLLGVLLALVIVVAGGAALFFMVDWPMRRAVTPRQLSVEATPQRLARGRELVNMRCAMCHYDSATRALTGHQLRDQPHQFGTFFSHNITRDANGLGRYSDGEIEFLLRTGIRRDGVFTGPMMFSPFLGDEDLYSIIAFLRSDDPLVKATAAPDRDSQPAFLYRMLSHLAFPPKKMPAKPIAVPEVKDQIAYGRYVVEAMADCFVCHSESFKTLDADDPDKSKGYLGGGNQLLDADGNTVRGLNITMDAETGIGKWSEADFVKTVRTGIRADGTPLRYPMTSYPELSEDEARATFAYLKTVPPIRNLVERATPPVASSDGEKLYNKYFCYSCHGKDGVGVCDLRRARERYDSDDKLAAFLHDASSFVPGTKMPTWRGVIAEPEFVTLVAYVRSLEIR
jgi:cytochrome c2